MLRNMACLLAGLVFCSGLAVAQLTTGTISGVVRDESGGVIPGVAVTARNLDTGIARQVSTNAQGRYQATNLPLGNYEVQAATSGFQTAVRTGITLMIGQEAAVDFTLRVGEVTTRV
ncbi:MAG: carboxypeptidase regulatory-like domain-containing protein, partial [Acidobacteria bacterium]|nr:carboxypeptidase regulatory-like domain-containing protein [Acidobacteriota bacterium]